MKTPTKLRRELIELVRLAREIGHAYDDVYESGFAAWRGQAGKQDPTGEIVVNPTNARLRSSCRASSHSVEIALSELRRAARSLARGFPSEAFGEVQPADFYAFPPISDAEIDDAREYQRRRRLGRGWQ